MLSALVSLLAPPLCVACGAPTRAHLALCTECRRLLRWLPLELTSPIGLPVWAAVSYEGPARYVVRALKYRGALRLADAMAAQMAANAPPDLVTGRSLVPVPLHPARRRRRGFNQAEQLARALARRSGLELANCLERTGGSRSTQVGRDRAARLGALGGSFRVLPGAALPLRALIVDDVITTGATLLACADALSAAGVHELAAIAYARTPGR